jgi:tetratricopeptide (TPR) repeat protein
MLTLMGNLAVVSGHALRQQTPGHPQVQPRWPDSWLTVTKVTRPPAQAQYHQQGKYAEAEALDSQTLEIGQRVLGRENPNTLRSMNNLALVYEDQGKYAEAEALFSQTLEIQRRVLGPEHPGTLRSMNNLASVLRRAGQVPAG